MLTVVVFQIGIGKGRKGWKEEGIRNSSDQHLSRGLRELPGPATPDSNDRGEPRPVSDWLHWQHRPHKVGKFTIKALDPDRFGAWKGEKA